jgi:hypothetical protein
MSGLRASHPRAQVLSTKSRASSQQSALDCARSHLTHRVASVIAAFFGSIADQLGRIGVELLPATTSLLHAALIPAAQQEKISR